MSDLKVVGEEHLRAGLDAVLGIDPSQAPTDPAALDERLTSPQPGITEALQLLMGSGQARHLARGIPLAYALLEAATRAYPEEMKDAIGKKPFVTSIAAAGPEAKEIVEAKGGDAQHRTVRERQPVLAKFVDDQLLSEGSFASKLTLDERTGLYALCLGTVRAIDRNLSGAEKPAVAAKVPGRNDPCHCGSGRKFKKCHGAPGVAA